MHPLSAYVSKLLNWSCKMASRPISFVIAWLVFFTWVIIGLIWGFSNTWLLIINTIATINASLMVFIIQSTQYRESRALHLKIDGIIKAIKEAEDELIAIEGMEEEQLEKIRKKIFRNLEKYK